ncbi:DUF4190 domain-containing protein [Streptomyces sp. I05A-00742]|uniref:DUF4190 domain-containing protein n=1 Tax=Streptomyces sp. I05A-00742 TaxID=2732853 RepID=UPI001488DBDD|nr:DUF4190 domain-containing protein [Streptomyces sp. I05A-00742]
MSDTGSAQQEPRDRDPWAPPPRDVRPGPGGVPLGKAAGEESRNAPWEAGSSGRPPVPPVPPVRDGGVPPVPLAPTGPGTPSAYQRPGPYGPQAGSPYAPPHPAYGRIPYGPDAYGRPGPPYGQGWAAVPAAVPDNGFGTAALVLGIVSLVLSVTMIFGVVLGVLAVIFGAVGRAKAVRGEASNRGQALAGLILGSLALVASVLVLVLVINSADSESEDERYDDGPDVTDVSYQAQGYGGYATGLPASGPLVLSASR